MVDFSEDSVFPQSVAIIEETDLVLGGSESNGPNRLAKPLLDRTRWLLDKVTELEGLVQGDTLLNRFHPIGSYYINDTDARNPSTFMGGTWVAVQGRTIVGKTGAGRFSTPGSVGGAELVALTVGNLAAHGHNVTQDAHSHTYEENSPTLDGGEVGYVISNNDATRVTRSTGPEFVNVGIVETGSNIPHENMPPYIVAYIWKRVN